MPLSRITGNSFNASANTNIDNGLLFLNPTTNRVGIFNTTPQGTLDVGGIAANHSAGDFLVSTNSTNAIVTVGRLSATGDDNTMFRVRNRVDETAFFVHAGNRTANVGLTFGVGGATPAASGSGITFPASQSASSDANTLDDYEEGTWTVNPVRWTWTGSKTGSYIKIGRLVHLNYVVDATSISYTGVGSGWAIDGWPFTIDSVAIALLGECTAFTANIFLDNIGNQLFGRTSTNTASGIGSGGNFNASGRIKFTLTYYTSS